MLSNKKSIQFDNVNIPFADIANIKLVLLSAMSSMSYTSKYIGMPALYA